MMLQSCMQEDSLELYLHNMVQAGNKATVKTRATTRKGEWSTIKSLGDKSIKVQCKASIKKRGTIKKGD